MGPLLKIDQKLENQKLKRSIRFGQLRFVSCWLLLEPTGSSNLRRGLAAAAAPRAAPSRRSPPSLDGIWRLGDFEPPQAPFRRMSRENRMDPYGSNPEISGVHKIRWYMGVHPPQNGMRHR